MRCAAFVLVAMAVAGPLSAQASNCAADATQAALNRCARQDSDRAVRRLSELLQALRGVVGEDRLAGLDSAQADWERFRSSHCGWEAAGYEGGSMQPMVLSLCWAAVTERRIAQLKPFLCDGGEPSCAESARFDLPRTSRRRP